MKKLLVASTLTFTLTASAFALTNENNLNVFDKNFYFKLEGGITKFNRLKENSIGVKLKSKPTGTVAVGFGGYFTDRIRADITFGHAFNPTFKYSGNNTIVGFINTEFGKQVLNPKDLRLSPQILIDNYDVNKAVASTYSESINKALVSIGDKPDTSKSLQQITIDNLNQVAKDKNYNSAQTQRLIGKLTEFVNGLNSKDKTADLYALLTTNLKDIKVSTTIKRKSQVENLMINSYFDLVEFANIKLFAGAGVGLAILREKISFDSNITANGKTLYSTNGSGKTKVAKNFAYALTLGTALRVADNMHAELSYAWKDFGKTKSLKYKNIEVGKTAYKSHSVTAGLRLDM